MHGGGWLVELLLIAAVVTDGRRPDPRGGQRAQPRTTSMGSELSAPRSGDDGATPAATRREPSAATIAPLSVHSFGLGTRSTMPAFAQRSSARARSREFAATPPPSTRWSTPR